jgi:hypothetical protein
MGLSGLAFLFVRQQEVRLDAKRLGQASQRFHRWVANTSLQIADIAALHLYFERQLLLRHTPQLPVMPDIFAEELDHIHPTMWP